MTLNLDYVRGLELAPVTCQLTDRDAMFYALSIGLSADPLDTAELPYTYEKGLKTFATMPLVLGHPGPWMRDPRPNLDYSKIVHGSQRLELFAPLPVGRPMISENRVVGLEDKGEKGAVITLRREIRDAETGTLYSRAESGSFARTAGGFGLSENPCRPFRPLPQRPADACVDTPTAANLALLYRLNMDRNPLHADPQVAARAGFSRPILHGLATFGIAAVALTRHFAGRELQAIEARFSRPVFPGETISVDIWDEGDSVAFRARVATRDVVVLDMGRARLRA